MSKRLANIFQVSYSTIRLYFQRQSSGGVLKKRCSKILQNLDEDTCAGVSFLIKSQANKKDTGEIR